MATTRLSRFENIGSNTYRIWHSIEKRQQLESKKGWFEKPQDERKDIERTPWVLEIMC
jgi:hypothetical protein